MNHSTVFYPVNDSRSELWIPFLNEALIKVAFASRWFLTFMLSEGVIDDATRQTIGRWQQAPKTTNISSISHLRQHSKTSILTRSLCKQNSRKKAFTRKKYQQFRKKSSELKGSTGHDLGVNTAIWHRWNRPANCTQANVVRIKTMHLLSPKEWLCQMNSLIGKKNCTRIWQATLALVNQSSNHINRSRIPHLIGSLPIGAGNQSTFSCWKTTGCHWIY